MLSRHLPLDEVELALSTAKYEALRAQSAHYQVH